MARYRRYRKRAYRSKKASELERFQWMIVMIVFIIVFLTTFAWRFTTNCIFEWPIRWDVGVCWVEQLTPSKEEAIEKAVNFAP